ncbi:MAG: hypothetical protein F4Y11_02735 [Chloroflexi bacterium]|nr:hypothetical protein [Chloroflexota bacterium]MYD73194.1 hypothetical protein [Chloroflexota bacterium]
MPAPELLDHGADVALDIRQCVLCDTQRMTNTKSSSGREGETGREETVNVLLEQLHCDCGIAAYA